MVLTPSELLSCAIGQVSISRGPHRHSARETLAATTPPRGIPPPSRAHVSAQPGQHVFRTRYDIFPEQCLQENNRVQVLDRALRCLISMYGYIRQYISCGETAHGVPQRWRTYPFQREKRVRNACPRVELCKYIMEAHRDLLASCRTFCLHLLQSQPWDSA